MGHQLLLCSSIPHKKYAQTVSTLEALTGLQRPQDIATYTIITKPHNVFKPKVEAGKVNQIEQYYMKCTTTWDDKASASLDMASPVITGQSEVKVERLFTGEKKKQWTFHIADIPNAGKNAVSAQNFYESTMVHYHTRGTKPITSSEKKPESQPENADEIGASDSIAQEGKADNDDDLMVVDDPAAESQPTVEKESPVSAANAAELKDSFLQFLEDLGYDVINQYWVKGIRFFHGDIVIEIFKVFIRDDSDTSRSENDTRIPLKLLDETNTFQIKTYITYPKGTNVDTITKGSKDLTHLKGTLNNLFELEVPDRMFLDSRVSRSI